MSFCDHKTKIVLYPIESGKTTLVGEAEGWCIYVAVHMALHRGIPQLRGQSSLDVSLSHLKK